MAETLRRVLNLGSAAGPGKNTAEAEPPLLLLGGPGSGKTALLFAAALEAAGEGRGPVLFLTRRPLQSLPRRTGPALEPLRLQVGRGGTRGGPARSGANGALSDRRRQTNGGDEATLWEGIWTSWGWDCMKSF